MFILEAVCWRSVCHLPTFLLGGIVTDLMIHVLYHSVQTFASRYLLHIQSFPQLESLAQSSDPIRRQGTINTSSCRASSQSPKKLPPWYQALSIDAHDLFIFFPFYSLNSNSIFILSLVFFTLGGIKGPCSRYCDGCLVLWPNWDQIQSCAAMSVQVHDNPESFTIMEIIAEIPFLNITWLSIFIVQNGSWTP